MSIHTLCIAAILATMNITACGDVAATNDKTTNPVVTIVKSYQCADGSEKSVLTDCPPGPVTEITKYVCASNGQTVADDKQCPAVTVTCPEGTTPYLNDGVNTGCLYINTCEGGRLYDQQTGTCKRACPEGTTLNGGGDDCVPVPAPTLNACAVDADCAAGLRCNTDGTCVIPCHRDGDCHDPALWCGQPAIKNDAAYASCQVNPNYVAGPLLVIKPDGSTPKSTIILGNSTDEPMSTFRFLATGTEDVLVNSIKLQNCLLTVAGTHNDCSDGASGPDDTVTVVRVSYVDQGHNSVTQSGILWNGYVTFDNLAFPVSRSTGNALWVSVDTNRVGPDGVASGNRIQLNVVNTNFAAVGIESGTNATVTYTAIGDKVVVGNPMTLRKTKPTISLASGSPSGAAIPGFSAALRFNVSADQHGFVNMDFFMFKISAGDSSGFTLCENMANPTKWELSDSNDPSNQLDDDGDWSFKNASGAPCKNGEVVRYAALYLSNTPTPNGSVTINAGETKTYVLRVDMTDASASNDDSIRIDIPDQNETIGLTPTWSNIVWEDDVEAVVWDGFLLKNLPIIGGTQVF